MSVRASLYKRREENQLDATECFYCTHNLLNMFRALICPSSGARDYTCVISAYGVQCLGCWWSAVRCRAVGYASGTYMPIIRTSRLYLCYFRIRCAMPWLLVVGGQVQGSRLCLCLSNDARTNIHQIYCVPCYN